ncbi:hypothetical protein J437_LFUL017976 [Ladona fulva]|uniref:Uncharacterized protein n=1 Tax=Ladona fulva TaxID=123851 RepID=A0A8K0KNF7_LADFU|nr:hypothetical protein J437_LFUL017976 [Ladona fulva]
MSFRMSFTEGVSTVSVEAVVGRSVALPCDIEPATREDRIYMVLWFRESAGKPMYRKLLVMKQSNDRRSSFIY